MRSTFGHQWDEEQWRCSQEQDGEEADLSSEEAQSHPDDDVRRDFHCRRQKAADEGVGMQLGRIQWQAIVAGAQSEPERRQTL